MESYYKLTEDDIAAILREKDRLLPLVIESFRTKSYVDGLNDLFDILEDIDLSGYHYFKASDVLMLETLRWFRDEVVPKSGKERDMRINQALIVCFVLYRNQKLFWRALGAFVIPIIADPEVSIDHAINCLGKRIYDLAYSNEVWERKICLAQKRRLFASLEQLKRFYPESGVAKYCNNGTQYL